MLAERTIHLPMRGEVGIEQVNTCYAEPAGVRLYQVYAETAGSDAFGAFYERTSEDNGRTWSAPARWYEPEVTPQGVVRRGEGALFLDEGRGRLLQFYNHALYPEGHFSGEVERFHRIFYRVSGDGGRTWGEGRQIVVVGGDERSWAPGVVYGENGMAVSFCAPLQLADGTLVLPVQRCPRGFDAADPWSILWEAGCLLGRWAGDELAWQMGELVSLPAEVSTRGLCEPTFAELPEGRLLMVCRGSNVRRPDLPGHKWLSLSTDGGRTWSAAEPFTYAGGQPFFSPATGSRLLRLSTGQLYWIGNIVPENPAGNSPRYPLQMAAVDEAGPGLIEESVRVIEDRRPGDAPSVQLSNFRVYEDRQTGELVLTMARFQERGEAYLHTPAYQYRWRLSGP